MVKELRAHHEDVACDVCGRTILKGERPEAFLAPGGMRKLVCELCVGRASGEGWIRESAAGDAPMAARAREPRRSLLGRIRRRRGDEAPLRIELEANGFEVAGPDEEPPTDEREAVPAAEPAGERVQRRRRRDARHVRAVPTNAEVKVERALELFNESEFPRKVAGIARSLGEPYVSATPSSDAPSEVVVVVAWELSWYRYRVDLGDAEEPVSLSGKGLEMGEIDAELRDWNASADAYGRLFAGVGSGS